MSDLMSDRELLESRSGSDARGVARTLTLTTLRRLDGSRKADVVRFLAESGLIDTAFRRRPPKCARRSRHDGTNRCKAYPVSSNAAKVSLRGADLRDLALANARLIRVDLSETDLRDATFENALLIDVRLNASDMRDSSFRRATILGGMLSGGRLERADFNGAHLLAQGPDTATPPPGLWWSVPSTLASACLTEASFVGATIADTDLTDVDGVKTSFRGATLTDISAPGAVLSEANLESARGAPLAWAEPARRRRVPGACYLNDPANRYPAFHYRPSEGGPWP